VCIWISILTVIYLKEALKKGKKKREEESVGVEESEEEKGNSFEGGLWFKMYEWNVYSCWKTGNVYEIHMII
jgi:hypothetical protein